MPKVTISAHSHVESFATHSAPVYARVYASQAFTNDDDESVGSGGIDTDNYVKQVAASYSAGVTTIASFATTNRLDSTVLPENNGILATYTLTLHNAKGKRVAVVYSGLALPGTLTTTTWANVELYNQGHRQPQRFAYYDRDQMDHLLDGLDLAPDATDVIKGKSYLSFLQASLGSPIAVGDNDPIVRATRKTVFLESYGNTNSGILNAIAAIGSDQAELRITSPTNAFGSTVITDPEGSLGSPVAPNTLTIPVNILVTYSGNGSFSVPTGKTLTINNQAAGAEQRVFYGTGDILVKMATIHLGWWSGAAVNHQHAVEQMRDSMTANVGGTMDFGSVNPVYATSIILPPFTDLIGHGNAVDGWDSGAGTIMCPPVDVQTLDDSGLTGAGFGAMDRFVLGVEESCRMNSIRNICLSSGTSGLIKPFLAKGTSGNSGFCLMFENVTFDGADAPVGSVPRVHIHSLDVGEWEIASLVFDHCFWVVPPNSYGFDIDTVNNNTTFNTCEFECGTGATGIHFDNAGYTEIINTEFRGVTGLTDVVTNSASLNISSASANFTSALIGATVTLSGGTPSCTHVSDVAAVPNAHTLTLEDLPPTTSTGVTLSLREDTTVATRTQTNTIITNNGSGNNWLDIVGGAQFSEADIGTKVLRNNQTFYITGLLFNAVGGLINRATLSTEIAPDATQRSASILQAGPNPGQAYAGIHVDGSHVTMTMRGCVSEGFEYLAVLEGFQLEGPHNFDGCWIQDRVLVNGSCEIALRGNHAYSQFLVEGNSGALTRVTSHGDSISQASKNFSGHITLDIPQIWQNRTGQTSYIQTEDSFPEGKLVSTRELPLVINDRSTDAFAGTDPILQVGTAKITEDRTPQALIQWGRLNSILRSYMDYWYKVGYHYKSGKTWFWSNQHDGYKGWQFQGIVEAKAFLPLPQDDAPGQITGDVDDWNPWTDSKVHKNVKITSNGFHNITGLALPDDPALTDFTQDSYEGLEVELEYSGAYGVILKALSGGSLPKNVFNMDDYGDITMTNLDRVRLIRTALQGWKVNRVTRVDKFIQLAADATYNNNSTLASSNLSLAVAPGSYAVELAIHTTSAVKSLKIDIAAGGSAVATITGQWATVAGATPFSAPVTSLGTSFSDASLDTLSTTLIFKGGIVVTTAGSINVRGAQRTADASDTKILAGSLMKITPTRLV